MKTITKIIAEGLDEARPGGKGFGLKHLQAVHLANAAPYLLKALEDIIAVAPDANGDRILRRDFLDKARAAISKAKGQT